MIAFFLPKKKQYLELDADTKITVTMTTPLTDPNAVSRVYTFEFTAPRNPHNDALLQHAYRVDSEFSGQDMACECVVGTLFAAGVLSLADTAQGGYRLNFKSNERNILDELEYKLATFAEETINLVPNTVIINPYIEYQFYLRTESIAASPGTGEFNFEMAIGTTTFRTSWDRYPPNQPAALQRLANGINIFSNSAMASVVNYSLVVKMPIDLTTGREKYQWNYPGFFRVDANVVINPYEETVREMAEKINSINRDGASDVYFPTVFAPNWYSADNLDFAKCVNNVDAQGNIIQNNYSLKSAHCTNSLVPMYKVSYVLKKIAKRLNLTLSGEWWAEPEAQRLLIFNAKSLDKWAEIELYNRTTKLYEKKYLNYGNSQITPGNHLPEMTAKAFLQQLCHDFGVYIEVKDGLLLLRRKGDLMKKLAKNRTKSIVADSMRFSPRLNTAAKIAQKLSENTVVPTGQLTPLSTNPAAKSQTDFLLETGTLPMTVVPSNDINPYFRKLPHFFEPAEDSTTALLFYRDMQPNENNTATYPYATSDDIGHDGTELGDWTLSPSGPKGLYNLHLKNIAELSVANEAELGLHPNVTDISIREKHYGRIFAYSINGHFEGVPKQIRMRFAKRGLDSVTMTCLVL